MAVLDLAAVGQRRWAHAVAWQQAEDPGQVLVDRMCVPAGDAVKPRLERVLTA